ncbi:MAG: GNAT family N-acetyltransferase [Oceanococcus sp.]
MIIEIREAENADLPQLSVLFDNYRQFYGQKSDLERAKMFILDRFECKDSILLVAPYGTDGLVGFTQLYPTFSSVVTARTFILNDLYVAPASRKLGVAKALLNAACKEGTRRGAVRLTLSTAVENYSAQQLYEREGWLKNEQFFHYSIGLPTENG